MDFNLKPIEGHTYVYSLPTDIEMSRPNATCVVVASTLTDVKPGQHVIVDLVNLDFRRLRVDNVQLFVVPNDAILLVLE